MCIGLDGRWATILCAQIETRASSLGRTREFRAGGLRTDLLQGLASVGVASRSAGVITTPGVAFLARSERFDAGVVISASHNPWTDNGIKIFSADGYKLPDAHELAIEKEIFALLQDADAESAPESAAGTASLPGEEALRQAYVRWLAAGSSADLTRLRVAVDCANGAAAAEAPELFRALKVHGDLPALIARWRRTSTRAAGRCIRRQSRVLSPVIQGNSI